MRLDLDEDGQGARLQIALPTIYDPVGSILKTLDRLGCWSRVETLARSAERFILYVRVTEQDERQISPQRLAEILRELSSELAMRQAAFLPSRRVA